MVGASVRAAAQGAVRARFEVSAVDLFGDTDLEAIAEVRRVPASEYPEGLVAAARSAPPGPWMYTGGLENYPEVVRAISEGRELLGCGPEVLRCARDPVDWRHSLESPTEGKWVLKPRRSCGGRGITLYEQPPYPSAREDQLWQEYKEGRPQSAVYVSCKQGFCLLGVTEQLIGETWTGAKGFEYGGSIGPVEVSQAVREGYQQIGAILSGGFALRGLFGVDTVLAPSGLPAPIELNPRYTASIEVLERGLPIEPLRWHVAACRENRLPNVDWTPEMNRQVHGKAILFARRSYEISQRFVDRCISQNEDKVWPDLADLPHAATRIEAGQPILTLFADGVSVESVRLSLKEKCGRLIEMLDRDCPAS